MLDDLNETDTLLDSEENYYKYRCNVPLTTNLLQSFRGRNHDIYRSMEEAAYKIFNFSVFKLAVIFERVRFYQTNVV